MIRRFLVSAWATFLFLFVFLSSSSTTLAQTCDSGTTTNALSYTCATLGITAPSTYTITSDVLSDNYACAQSDGSGVSVTVDCTGIGLGVIACLQYASSGQTAGSCGSCATSLADGDMVEFVAAADGVACIGQSSCTLSVTTSITNPKTKVLAYCGASVPSPTSGPTAAPTPAPTQAPVAAPTGSPPASCFSESATVQVLVDDTTICSALKSTRSVSMKELVVGQKILAGYKYNKNNKIPPLEPYFETVYGFGHRSTEEVVEYLQISTTTTTSSSTRPLEITGNHLIYLAGTTDPVRADSLQVGDELLVTPPPSSLLNLANNKNSTHHVIVAATQQAKITKIERVQRQGLYQPLTKDGTIIVDGIHASNYVSVSEIAPRVVQLGLTVFSEQSGFHLWMAPHRFLCTKVAPQVCAQQQQSNYYNEEKQGICDWLIFGKAIMEIGERLPTWLTVVMIGVLLSFCGFIMAVDILLEGDIFLFGAAVCVMVLLCVTCRKRQAGKTSAAPVQIQIALS